MAPRPSPPAGGWHERYQVAIGAGRHEEAANLALGALFERSHAAHHALTELAVRCSETGRAGDAPSDDPSGAAATAVERLRLLAADELAAVGAAGAALGRALFAAPRAPGRTPQADAEPLALQQAAGAAHAALAELVSSWHATSEGRSSLEDFGAALAASLGVLAALERAIRRAPAGG
jgi:hypothetical protein